MDKNCAENFKISGVDRVSPLHKACPERMQILSPKTPEYKTVSRNACRLFLFKVQPSPVKNNLNSVLEIIKLSIKTSLKRKYDFGIIGWHNYKYRRISPPVSLKTTGVLG